METGLNNLIENPQLKKLVKGACLSNKHHSRTFKPNPTCQELVNNIYKAIWPISQQTKVILDAVSKIPPLDPEMIQLCNQSLQIWQEMANSEEWQQMLKMQALFAEQLRSSAWIDLSEQVIEVTRSILDQNWSLYVDIQNQLPVFSTDDSLKVSSELSRQIAVILQTACPLFSPEYIQTMSHLAAAVGLTVDDEWTGTDLPDIADTTDEDEKLIKLTAFKEKVIAKLEVPLSDSLPLESPYSLGFYQVWLKVPQKAQFLEIVLELAAFCYTMLFMSDSISAFLRYATAIRALIQIYRLGTCFLAPAIQTRFVETSDSSKT